MTQKFCAELIGTFALVFFAIGAGIFAGSEIGNIGISLSVGFTVLCMVYIFGSISGCHINPAVTLGFFIKKRITLHELIYYWLAQVVGGVLAAFLIVTIYKGSGNFIALGDFASNGFGEYSAGNYSRTVCFIAEMIGTAFLVLVVLMTTRKSFSANHTGIVIGFALVALHLVLIPITGCSVNPARSIATAIFQGGWALKQVWLFILAPFVGSFLGAMIFCYFKDKKA